MRKSIETIAGDTEGVVYEFPVFRFEGADPAAPGAYLQAALHAGELPGTVALDALMPLLEKAEAEGRVRQRITVVPWANPVGRAQYFLGEQQGRFHLGTRTNFNRDFPLLERPDPALLPDTSLAGVDRKLKARLLALSLGHDIVLDLHCDNEAVMHLYTATSLWSRVEPLARLLGAWPVSVPAIVHGRAALADRAWQQAARVRLSTDAGRLRSMLAAHRLAVAGGTDLFVLVKDDRAATVHEALARQGVWTRVFDEMSTWMRIGLPAPDQFDRLERALDALP